MERSMVAMGGDVLGSPANMHMTAVLQAVREVKKLLAEPRTLRASLMSGHIPPLPYPEPCRGTGALVK